MKKYIDAEEFATLLKEQVVIYEEVSEKTYHKDAHYDTDKHYGRHRDYGNRADGCEKALELLNSVSAADVRENIHSHWVHRHYPSRSGNTVDTVVCIECREEYSYDAETGISAGDYKFCPNCGAIMRRK